MVCADVPTIVKEPNVVMAEANAPPEAEAAPELPPEHVAGVFRRPQLVGSKVEEDCRACESGRDGFLPSQKGCRNIWPNVSDHVPRQ